MINVAVVGSRTYKNYKEFKGLLSQKLFLICDREEDYLSKVKIVSGGAIGVDSMAERFAREYNIPIKVFKANWEFHGRGAGYIRNNDIMHASNICIAFWDEESRGTKHTINLFRKSKKDVHIINFKKLLKINVS